MILMRLPPSNKGNRAEASSAPTAAWTPFRLSWTCTDGERSKPYVAVGAELASVLSWLLLRHLSHDLLYMGTISSAFGFFGSEGHDTPELFAVLLNQFGNDGA